MANRVYFRQLLSGRDFAIGDPLASEMVNFVYLIGDRKTGEAVVVDPAYDVDGIIDIANADGMTIAGVLATHFHPDHVGGDLADFSSELAELDDFDEELPPPIEGVKEVLERVSVPIHVQHDEADLVRRVTGLGNDDLVSHRSGDVVSVGDIEIELIHTPGHTPGSQCFLMDGRLLAGDTLFLDACGRTDLPGSDPAAMYDSLTYRLAKVSNDTILFPGHDYSSKPFAAMGETRRTSYVFVPKTAEEWVAVLGGRPDWDNLQS